MYTCLKSFYTKLYRDMDSGYLFIMKCIFCIYINSVHFAWIHYKVIKQSCKVLHTQYMRASMYYCLHLILS